MNEQIKDGGPAFGQVVELRCVRVDPTGAGEWGPDICCHGGLTVRDYAEIHFASAWAIALGVPAMAESRESRTAEANRLGRIQADEFIAAREAKS